MKPRGLGYHSIKVNVDRTCQGEPSRADGNLFGNTDRDRGAGRPEVGRGSGRDGVGRRATGWRDGARRRVPAQYMYY